MRLIPLPARPVRGLMDPRFAYAPALETDIRATFARATSGDQPFTLPQLRKQAMNTTALTTVVLEPIELSDADKATAIDVIRHMTVDTIAETLKSNPVNLQAPGLAARSTFSRATGLMRTLAVFSDAPIDCTTTAGDKEARAARLLLVTFRNRIDDLRKDSTQPYRDQTKAHNDFADLMIDTVKTWERRYDDAIKAQEKVVADRKAVEQAKADERAREVAARIANLHALADVPAGLSSSDIRVRIQDATLVDVNAEDFDHRHGEAISVKDRAIDKLEAAAAAAEQHEAREAQIAADRAAFEKQLDEQRKQIAAAAQQKRMDDDAAATRAAEADALRQREQEMRDQEAAARQRISDMRGIPAWALTATAEAIRAKQEELEDMNQAQFHPLEHEALAAHEEVTKALPVALAFAEERERTEAQRQFEKDRATRTESFIAKLKMIGDGISKPGLSMRVVDAAQQVLDEVSLEDEIFGNRLEEVREITTEQRQYVDAARIRVQGELDAAAEAERQRQEAAAQEAKRSRRDAVMRMNGADLYALMAGVRLDPDYLHLDEALRARIDAKMADIAAAL